MCNNEFVFIFHFLAEHVPVVNLQSDHFFYHPVQEETGELLLHCFEIHKNLSVSNNYFNIYHEKILRLIFFYFLMTEDPLLIITFTSARAIF